MPAAAGVTVTARITMVKTKVVIRMILSAFDILFPGRGRLKVLIVPPFI